MLNHLLKAITGKDDLERLAARGDMPALKTRLEKRKVLIPKKPHYFLKANTFTQDELLSIIQKESETAQNEAFEPWILEVNGMRRLPVFSSRKKNGNVFETYLQRFKPGFRPHGYRNPPL
jgi:hypothetical protein